MNGVARGAFRFLSTASGVAMILTGFIFSGFVHFPRPASCVGCLVVPPVPQTSEMKDKGTFLESVMMKLLHRGGSSHTIIRNKPNSSLSVSRSANLHLC